MDLLTVVLHELGHLLGYEHSDDPDDLMAPVLSASPLAPSSFMLHPSSLNPAPSSFTLPPSSLILPPSSFILSPASRADDVFAELESSDEASWPLWESPQGTDVLAAAALKSSDEAPQVRVPRRSPQRYERELDKLFTELAAEEAS